MNKNKSKTILLFNFLARLPKWFGERPGKKAGDPDTPEGEEDVKADEVDDGTYCNLNEISSL